MLTGEYAYLNEIVDSAYVTGRAVITDYSQRDSLFMHADTIWAVSYNLDTDSLYRQVKAYNKALVNIMTDGEKNGNGAFKGYTNLMRTIENNYKL